MKKYILIVIAWIISLYLSFTSFVLVKIVTNDIILNSYKVYSYTKINGNQILNKTEDVVDKWKLLWNKLTNKEKAKQLEQEQKNKQQENFENQEKLREELEFNPKVLFWLPYILFIIIFIFTYVKVSEWIDKFLEKLWL